MPVDFGTKPDGSDTSGKRRNITGRDRAAVIMAEAGGFEIDQDVPIAALKKNDALRVRRSGG